MYCLNHNDGVVHNGSDNENQGEQCDHIKTESCHFQESECSNERDDDSYSWDESGTETLQEDINDQDNQNDGKEESDDDVLDRSIEEVFGTHQVDDFNAFR